MRELLDRRLLVVLGKGGVGRTTIASALAVEAARAGKRVLLVGVDSADPISRIFRVRLRGWRPVELEPNLLGAAIDLQAILDEFVRQALKVRSIAERAVAHPVYQYFTAVAPGIRELLALDRIREAASDRRIRGRRYDLVVVDGPATGHGLSFLEVPRAAAGTFKVGLLRGRSDRILELLRDPERAAAILVTLAEEMPVSETLELHQALEERVGIAVGGLVVNAVYPEPMPDFSDPEVLALLRPRSRVRRTLSRHLDAAAGKGATRLAAAALEFAWHRRGLNVEHMDRLLSQLDEPYVEVPRFDVGGRPRALVERVARAILGPSASPETEDIGPEAADTGQEPG